MDINNKFNTLKIDDKERLPLEIIENFLNCIDDIKELAKLKVICKMWVRIIDNIIQRKKTYKILLTKENKMEIKTSIRTYIYCKHFYEDNQFLNHSFFNDNVFLNCPCNFEIIADITNITFIENLEIHCKFNQAYNIQEQIIDIMNSIYGKIVNNSRLFIYQTNLRRREIFYIKKIIEVSINNTKQNINIYALNPLHIPDLYINNLYLKKLTSNILFGKIKLENTNLEKVYISTMKFDQKYLAQYKKLLPKMYTFLNSEIIKLNLSDVIYFSDNYIFKNIKKIEIYNNCNDYYSKINLPIDKLICLININYIKVIIWNGYIIEKILKQLNKSYVEKIILYKEKEINNKYFSKYKKVIIKL